jgi:hypothetical protein
MRKWIGLWLLSLFAVALIASEVIRAQRLPPNEYRILSGADIGFRVEGTDAKGRPMGRWVVRIDGQWIETSSEPVMHRLN